jgi:hypothetical protein
VGLVLYKRRASNQAAKVPGSKALPFPIRTAWITPFCTQAHNVCRVIPVISITSEEVRYDCLFLSRSIMVSARTGSFSVLKGNTHREARIRITICSSVKCWLHLVTLFARLGLESSRMILYDCECAQVG